MPFNGKSGKFNASINAVEIGCGEKAIKIGGENVMPMYAFDAPIENAPKVGIMITDLGLDNEPDCVKAFYEGCTSFADIAKKAASFEGVDFVCLELLGADPNGEDKSTEECMKVVKEVIDAIDVPVVIAGCKNGQKDSELLTKAAEVAQGKNVLILAAKEENYKGIGAAAGLAYNQKVGAESAVDINLAKQLNVLISQLGVAPGNIVMNVGTAAVGYGFEYVVSTMDRVKAAALGQADAQLQMPIITPIADDVWGTKEAVAAEADVPEWGAQEERGICMEVSTAASVLASGSNAVIMKHPTAIATISKMIAELV